MFSVIVVLLLGALLFVFRAPFFTYFMGGASTKEALMDAYMAALAAKSKGQLTALVIPDQDATDEVNTKITDMVDCQIVRHTVKFGTHAIQQSQIIAELNLSKRCGATQSITNRTETFFLRQVGLRWYLLMGKIRQ